MWEREFLLLAFESWRTYTRIDWQSIETNVQKLGEKVILRHFFKTWLENHSTSIKQANEKIDIICTERSRCLLIKHLSWWFHFSRSRGRRIRNTRKYWNNWLSHGHQRKQERESFSDLVRKLHFVKKAGLVIRWQNATRCSLQRCTEQREKILRFDKPRLLYLLTLWTPAPKLSLISCWKLWKGFSQSSVLFSSPNDNSLGTKQNYESYFSNEEGEYEYDRILPSCNFGERYNSLSARVSAVSDESIERIVHITEDDISIKKIELAQAILKIQEKKSNVDIAKKNIIVQKRTLKLYQREIENHCCICGGIHNSNDHIPHRKHNCKVLKKKQQVFKYLQQSLTESNARMDSFKDALEKGVEEKTTAKLKMNHSLISYIKSSCSDS